MLKKVLALVLIAAMPAVAHAGDAEKGEKVFKKCKACHAVGEGAKNKVGPALNGIVGRAAASAEGFKYSKPLQDSGWTWDEATLDKWLSDRTTNVLKGTKMIFAGLKKDDQRADVIAYLKTFGADGKPAK